MKRRESNSNFLRTPQHTVHSVLPASGSGMFREVEIGGGAHNPGTTRDMHFNYELAVTIKRTDRPSGARLQFRSFIIQFGPQLHSPPLATRGKFPLDG